MVISATSRCSGQARKRFVRSKKLHITTAEADRMDALMAQYKNVPMDLADASLVAVAEGRGIRRLFTIDSDFHIYRLADSSVRLFMSALSPCVSSGKLKEETVTERSGSRGTSAI